MTKVAAFLGFIGAAVYMAGTQCEAVQLYAKVVFTIMGLE
jgi:hypothetical protein